VHHFRKTHFFGLDLIPANLKLYDLEYEIAGYSGARTRTSTSSI